MPKIPYPGGKGRLARQIIFLHCFIPLMANGICYPKAKLFPAKGEMASPMPTIAYPGGKARLARQIVSMLPKDGHIYVEPFAGRGNIFWCAVSQGLTFRKWWLNDIATMSYFHAIREIGNTIQVPECSRAEYERQREAFKSGDQTAILLEPYLSFGGNGYLHSGFRGTRRGGVSASRYEQTLRECHQIIHQTQPRLSSLDWSKMGLEKLGPQDVVVIDAPYPDTQAAPYTDETVDYVTLVDLLLKAKFRWVYVRLHSSRLHRLGEPVCATDVRFLYFPDNRGTKIRRREKDLNVCGANSPPNPPMVATRCRPA